MSPEPPESPAGNCAKWSVATLGATKRFKAWGILANNSSRFAALDAASVDTEAFGCAAGFFIPAGFFRTALDAFLPAGFFSTLESLRRPRVGDAVTTATLLFNCSCARSTWLDSGAGPTRSSSASNGFCCMGCCPAARSCSGSPVVTGVPETTLGTGVPEPMAPELPALHWTVSKVTPGVPMFTNPLCPDAAGPQCAA